MQQIESDDEIYQKLLLLTRGCFLDTSHLYNKSNIRTPQKDNISKYNDKIRDSNQNNYKIEEKQTSTSQNNNIVTNNNYKITPECECEVNYFNENILVNSKNKNKNENNVIETKKLIDITNNNNKYYKKTPECECEVNYFNESMLLNKEELTIKRYRN